MNTTRLKHALSFAATTAIVVAGTGAIAPAAEADTITCRAAPKLTHIQVSASQLFAATGECNGVYAYGVERQTDDVRGRFYKDKKWQFSSYGWVRIRKDQNGLDKIVGNTITGREIKGQGKNVVQQVGYAY